MPVLVTPLANAYSHISYLVHCDATGEAAAIDPFDVELTLEAARSRGLRITQIINTHEHWDHAGRNEEVRAATGAKVLAAKWAAGVIERIDTYLAAGDMVRVGSAHELEVIETPGHTMTHISLLGEEGGSPFLLCGDTLFGAGVGNCAYGGHAPTLFRTVESLRARLDPETLLYPGHDYLKKNLGFTLAHEPGNEAAKRLVSEAGQELRFTRLRDELQINLFFRLDSSEVRGRLIEDGQVSSGAGPEELFLALRRLRDSWS